MTPETFWKSKIAITANTQKCWEWLGYKDKDGYGTMYCSINNKVWRKAHRAAYFLFYEIDPEKLLVCHSCDNPSCCNPMHLFLGSIKTNNADRAAKGRSVKGERSHHAKFTNSQIVEVKERLLKGETTSKLAKEFKVSFQSLYAIKNGKNWGHIKI